MRNTRRVGAGDAGPEAGALSSAVLRDRALDGPAVPRPLLVTACVVLLASSVMLFAGAWRIGISYDEPYHVMRLQNYLDLGWFLLADDLHDGRPGSWVHDVSVYAPVAALLLHGANLVAGNDAPGVVAATAEAYAVRHVGVALLSLPAAVSAAALAKILLGRWQWGVVASAVLVAMPVWSGHAMVNMKDVPVATGYSLVTLSLALTVTRAGARRPERLAVVACLVAGTVLAVGTRPGIWPGLAAGVGICWFALWRMRDGEGLLQRRGSDVMIGLVMALALLVLIYPEGFFTWTWIFDSVFSSADYSGVKSSRLTLLGAVIRNVPLLLLLLGVVGLLVVLRRVSRSAWATPRGAVLVLVLSQALLLPLLAAVNASALHGLRQLLFAAPAVAVLLTLGLAKGFPWRDRDEASGAGHASAPQRFTALAAALALLIPVLDQVRLFPYAYSYSSVALLGTQWRVGIDQWRTSVRELEPSVPHSVAVVCTPSTDTDGNLMRYSVAGGRSPVERSRDCRTDDLSPLRPYRVPDPGLESQPVSPQFAAIVTVPLRREPRNCELLDEVTRSRWGVEQFMSRVYSCRLVLHDAPSTGLAFDGFGANSEYLLGGWTGSPAQPGVQLIGTRGDLGFAWPTGIGRSFEVELWGDVTRTTQVLVNNTPVGVLEPGKDRHRLTVVDLPVSALDAAGLVLTVRAAASGRTIVSHVAVGEAGGR